MGNRGSLNNKHGNVIGDGPADNSVGVISSAVPINVT